MKKIIAVDFDGTLCVDAYPRIGQLGVRHHIIHNYIKQEHKEGAVIILWTCRCGDKLTDALVACKKWGIPIDYINENYPEIINRYGFDCRKIYADVYVDDKSFNPQFNSYGGTSQKLHMV